MNSFPKQKEEKKDMFLTEKELRDTFWKNYNYSGRAIKYQFECAIREGAADLVTIEQFQGNYQINAFEFKLTDIKKALLQARANAEYVNKSWIVVPVEKAEVILNKYQGYLKEYQIGVITIEEGGRWQTLYQAYYRHEVRMNQAILNLIMKGY